MAETKKKITTKKVVSSKKVTAKKPSTKPKTRVTEKEALMKAAKKKVDKIINKEKFAVVKISGSQLKVFEGMFYEVMKLAGQKGDKLVYEEVLLTVDGDKVTIGKPFVKGAKVEFEIKSQFKDKKLRVYKYKAKSRYRKSSGHRQDLTRVFVNKILAG